MRTILFLCSRNKLRSPTAEQVFSGEPGIEVASAGLDNDAEVACTPELLEWADTVFVMERAHKAKLARRFAKHLRHARVVCLDIPDNYGFMQPDLVRLLQARVGPHLRQGRRPRAGQGEPP